jgi:hypothetical protein
MTKVWVAYWPVIGTCALADDAEQAPTAESKTTITHERFMLWSVRGPDRKPVTCTMLGVEGHTGAMKRLVVLVPLTLSAAALFAGPARGFETEQERQHGWALSVAGKRAFPKNFLCVRVGATDAQDIFVVKPRPPYTRTQALAALHNAGLPGTIEFRLKPWYLADVAGLARAISREEPAQFRAVAHVGPQVLDWTPGGRCPSVGIDIPPPGNPASTTWAEQTAAKYGADRVTVEHATIALAV